MYYHLLFFLILHLRMCYQISLANPRPIRLQNKTLVVAKLKVLQLIVLLLAFTVDLLQVLVVVKQVLGTLVLLMQRVALVYRLAQAVVHFSTRPLDCVVLRLESSNAKLQHLHSRVEVSVSFATLRRRLLRAAVTLFVVFPIVTSAIQRGYPLFVDPVRHRDEKKKKKSEIKKEKRLRELVFCTLKTRRARNHHTCCYYY